MEASVRIKTTHWTKGELDFLKAHYAKEKNTWIAIKLHRSVTSIRKHAFDLGLKKEFRGDQFIPQAKVLRVFTVLMRLHKGPATLQQLHDGTGIPERTVWRYLSLIKCLDIGLWCDEGKRFHIDKTKCPLCGIQPTTTTN